MAEPIDLDKHRQSLSEQLAALASDVEQASAGGHLLAEFGRQLHALVEHQNEQLTLHRAETLLFQKLFLASARLSTDFSDFKVKCLQLEVQLGFVKARPVE